MRVLSGRRSAVLVAALATILVLTALGLCGFAAKSPAGLSSFKCAIGRIESGGNYTARNPKSGAYGKYQIMPSNWPAWARRYLGNAQAKQTPANQEKVATRQDHLALSLARQLEAGRVLVAHRFVADHRLVAATRSATSPRSCATTEAAAARTPRPRPNRASDRRAERPSRSPTPGPGGAPGTAATAATRSPTRSRPAPRATFTFTGRKVIVVRPDRPDTRQGQGLRRRHVRHDRRPASPLVRRTDGPLHGPLEDGRQAHADDRRRRHAGHPMVAIDDFVVTK